MPNTHCTTNLEPNTVSSFQNETESKINKFDAISDMSKTRRSYLNSLVKKLTKNYARHRRIELGDIDTALATAVLSCARSLEMRVARGKEQQDYHHNIIELLNQIDSKTQNRILYEELLLYLKEPYKDHGKDPKTYVRRHSYNNEHSYRNEKPCAKKPRLNSFHGKELSLKRSAPLAVVSIDPHCERNKPPENHPPSTNINLPECNTDSHNSTYSQPYFPDTKDLITNLYLPLPPPTVNNKVVNTVPDTPSLNCSTSQTIPPKSVSKENEMRNSALQESNMWSGHGWKNIQPWVNYMYANQFMTINIPFTMSPHAYKDTHGDINYSDELTSKVFLPPPPPTNIIKSKAEEQVLKNEDCKKSIDLLKQQFHRPVSHSREPKDTLRKNKYAELLKTALCSPDHWETVEEWLNHTHYFPKPVNFSITKQKHIHLKEKQNNVLNISPKHSRKRSFNEGNMPQTFQHLKSRYKSRQPPSKSSKIKFDERDIVHRPKINMKSRKQLQVRSKTKIFQSTFDSLHRTKPSIPSHKSPLPMYSPPTNSPDPPWSINNNGVTLNTSTSNKNIKLSVTHPTSNPLDVESLLGKPIDFGEDNDTIIKGLEDMFKSEDELESKGTVDRINSNVCNESDLLRDLEDEDIYELTRCLEEGLEQTSPSKVDRDATKENADVSIVKKNESNCEGNESTFEQKLNTFSTLCENISEGKVNNVSPVKPVSVPTIWPCEAHYQRLHLCQEMEKICDENWKKYSKIKIKFEQLFGENSEDELAPQSPIAETRAFVQSCKRRIVPWLLRHLSPYYKVRRIHDRSLFKVVARHLGMRIVEWNRYPSEKQVREYIQNYFRGHRKITCLSDIL